MKATHQTYSTQKNNFASEEASICAVVVAYFPDDDFDARIQIVLEQVALLVIVDNTPQGQRRQQLRENYQNESRVFMVENAINMGVATALNQGLAIAAERRFQWLLTLDQDTRCYPDMAQTLIRVASLCGSSAAVIGGNYFDSRVKKHKIATDIAGDYSEQTTVITSGSLLNVCIATQIGGFRDDYFIDQVDHEFCLRARAHGYRVYISRVPVMQHSIGIVAPSPVSILGIVPPDHPPFRKYYIARNSVVSIMDYWKREPLWCVRRTGGLMLKLVLIVLLQKGKLPKLRAFFTGLVDGVQRRMGPCTREQSTRFL